jgi:hypothetical protein
MPNNSFVKRYTITTYNYGADYNCQLWFFTNQIGKFQTRYSQNFNIAYTSIYWGDGKGCFTSASSKKPGLCGAKVGSKHIGGLVEYIIMPLPVLRFCDDRQRRR